jgi:enterochelin esterase-like enzyme
MTERPGLVNDTAKELLRRIQTAHGAREGAPGESERLIAELHLEIARTGAPLYLDDSNVLFVYLGEETLSSVGLLGDMTSWESVEPMRSVPGSGLFYLVKTFEPGARLEYMMVPEGAPSPVTDPLNPYVVLDGLGGHSELAMPAYKRHPLFAPFERGTRGDYTRVQRFEMPPGALSYPHEIFVYLPPGYTATSANYPTLYLQDGRDYIEFAAVSHVLDGLIGTDSIAPVVAVMICPPNRHTGKFPNRATEYGLNGDYVSFCVDEVRPWVDRTFRTSRTSSDRLVAGASFGGLISFHTAFLRGDVFGNAYCQSSYFSFGDDAARRVVEGSPRQAIRLFVDVGTYEWIVGPQFIPPPEQDFLQGNRRMRSALESAGYDLVYREYPEGHTWGNWRTHLIEALKHFFGRTAHATGH